MSNCSIYIAFRFHVNFYHSYRGDSLEDNGIVSADSSDELDRVISWAITNPEGCGIRDIFGTWVPIVRPQECMFTPTHLKIYRKHGIKVLSIFYSGLPFNGFSTFVPPLTFVQRYNPMHIKNPENRDSMILLPAYNHGDIADHFACIKRWIQSIRKKQKNYQNNKMFCSL